MVKKQKAKQVIARESTSDANARGTTPDVKTREVIGAEITEKKKKKKERKSKVLRYSGIYVHIQTSIDFTS